MKTPTIQFLVQRIQTALVEEDIFLSPHDVGHVISLFLEGLIHDPSPSMAPLNAVLQDIADQCESVPD